MANRGRGRGRYSWSRGLQQSVQGNRTWHRAAGHPTVPGVGGGQSWDPFRPLRDLQPTLVSSEVLPASGRNVAYTRTSLSKLVLQKTASEVNTSKVQDERKESGFQHIRQPAPLAKSALPSQTPAARAVHISGATQGQTTQQSAAERRAHAAGQGAIGAAHLQPRLRKSGTAEAAVRHTRRTWQRQSKAGPSPAVGSLLQTPKRKGQTQEPTVIATHRHANTWQRTAQPPRFARRRGNQLVRLSSASPAYSSVLLRSGSRRSALQLPIARSTKAALSARTHVATTPRASSVARLSSSAGASPSVLVRRGNKLVRVSRRAPPVPTQVYRKHLPNLKPAAQGLPPTVKVHRAQNQLQRPTQLRRIGSVMYRVGKSANGSHSLQRTETPRRILKPAAALTPGPRMPSRPQTPKYIRRAGKLVRMATPNAALLKPVAAVLASEAKAAAASRLLKQAKMQRHCNRVYIRQPRAHGNPATPRQPALCPAFCRTGRCEGQRKGQCRLRHDPAWVTVCFRWLHGSCTDAACSLQHAASPDIMPLCMFHLKGQCSKDSCIYLHKELPASSGVCRAYAAGFCPRGQACTQKHLTPKMLRELRASRTLRAGNAKVAASKSQASSSGQGPPKAVKAASEHEDGGKKRKWRYFWAEEEEAG